MCNYIETYTGKKLFPLQPSQKDICIEDIAHALSLVCRFGGHIKVSWYSVGQHSVLVANYIKDLGYDDNVVLAGLLHDATEGLGFSDICRPVKHQIPEIKIKENVLNAAIMKKFGVSEKSYTDRIIKEADYKILITEVRDILKSERVKDWFKLFGNPLDKHINPWVPMVAEQEFLRKFSILYAKNK